MNNEIATVDSWEAYQRLQETAFAKDSYPTPPAVKFKGDTGVYYRSKLNESGEWEREELGREFRGVVLAVRWFARWKYKENAPFDIRTREFSDFQRERIELLKIDNANRSSEAEVKAFDNYRAFKQNYTKKDDEMGTETVPFDLYGSLYVLKDGEVVRYRFKGTTRSNWFDYMKATSNPAGVVTLFGCSEAQDKPTGKGKEGESDVYYSGTFTDLGEIPQEDRPKVMAAARDLFAWFRAWEEKRDEARPVEAVSAPDMTHPALGEPVAMPEGEGTPTEDLFEGIV